MNTKKATLQNISFDTDKRNILVTISAKDSLFVQDPNGIGFPQLMNSAILVEGIKELLEFDLHALDAMRGNTEFKALKEENRILRKNIVDSNLGNYIGVGTKWRYFFSSVFGYIQDN